LGIKKKLTKIRVWSVVIYGSEKEKKKKNEERVLIAFETQSWRRMLKIKWTDRITNDEVFQKAKEERLLLQTLKNKCHSWIGHTVWHNEFVVNILEGAISGKEAVGRPRLQYLKQVARNTGADRYTTMERMACNNTRWKAANQSTD
jgi:porphobilinogen deaminase